MALFWICMVNVAVPDMEPVSFNIPRGNVWQCQTLSVYWTCWSRSPCLHDFREQVSTDLAAPHFWTTWTIKQNNVSGAAATCHPLPNTRNEPRRKGSHAT